MVLGDKLTTGDDGVQRVTTGDDGVKLQQTCFFTLFTRQRRVYQLVCYKCEVKEKIISAYGARYRTDAAVRR